MSSPMEELKIGGAIFEIADGVARKSINEIKSNIKDFDTIRDLTNGFAEDIEKLKHASITPDTSLKIEGAAADSKVVGDSIDAINGEIEECNTNINDLKNKVETLNYNDVGALPNTFKAVTSLNGVHGDVIIDEISCASSLMAKAESFVDQNNDDITELKKILRIEEENKMDSIVIIPKIEYKKNEKQKSIELNNLCIGDGYLSRVETDNTYKIYDQGNKPISIVKATVLKSQWIENNDKTFTQDVSISGISERNHGHIDIDMSSATINNAYNLQEAWAMIGRVQTLENAVRFTCYEEMPNIDIDVIIEVID